MILFVAAVAGFVAIVGLYGVVFPSGLRFLVRFWHSQGGFLFAVALRLIFGVALWIVAAESRTPLALQILAMISITAGVALPLMGLSRFESLLTWWELQGTRFVRMWCVAALALGLFLLWSVAT